MIMATKVLLLIGYSIAYYFLTATHYFIKGATAACYLIVMFLMAPGVRLYLSFVTDPYKLCVIEDNYRNTVECWNKGTWYERIGLEFYKWAFNDDNEC